MSQGVFVAFFQETELSFTCPSCLLKMEKNEGKAMAPVDSNRLKISDRYVNNGFEFDGENRLKLAANWLELCQKNHPS